MSENKNFIAIGKIVKTIEIKGNLKIIPLTDFTERFYTTHMVYLFNEKENNFFVNGFTGGKEFAISESKVFENYVNVRFDLFNSIERSKELIDLILMIDEKDRIKLEEGNFYYYELVGCDVYENDVKLGRINSIQNYGSGDLFNIQYGDREILIPFNKEFVKEIDTAKKRVDVKLIDGFLD